VLKSSWTNQSNDFDALVDWTGSTAQVSSTEKDEAKHGSNEPDVPMAVEKRTSTGDQGFRHCSPVDDDVFYLFLQKQKLGAKLHIYL
jgi:hypothetical protein